jgi:uncharacterized membrane protein
VLTTILAWIVFWLIVALPIMAAVFLITVGLIVTENHLIAQVLVFLVVSSAAGMFIVYVSTRLLMYYYLIIDREARVLDSLWQSWNLCRTRMATIVLVLFVELAVFLAGFLVCLVGLILALPFMELLRSVTYMALIGTTSRPERPEFVGEDDI